jgi:hypothetical protein
MPRFQVHPGSCKALCLGIDLEKLWFVRFCNVEDWHRIWWICRAFHRLKHHCNWGASHLLSAEWSWKLHTELWPGRLTKCCGTSYHLGWVDEAKSLQEPYQILSMLVGTSIESASATRKSWSMLWNCAMREFGVEAVWMQKNAKEHKL